MRTAEEMLKEAKNNDNGFGNNEIISLMKKYAKEVAKEALKNASENVMLIDNEGEQYREYHDSVIYDCFCIVDKQSILNESNIPEL